ncbi:UNVERIFIED_ORG: secondary thiamine-phosphate synthase enzyme [Methylobacterium sp. SuP10 SLI 274]|uniref:secondary thiamine-phosphate synthase enzyme YjbQ n=1 Tax=Methylorubrum extorquens TaxID=408 RepID=UPI0020A00A5C|nr:secondary thiamine-phosphate synthase enzyme YjbQ [Methylorubrum extorquens]MDF9864515.1 secondary thiamine-phosphate synthase enzyme [Methylorubrum pseudosasae]MDH6638104.1 secondary thiamine-phosphate synthase enzyme [Methylobacterium sp. SuP10 SLI 274]MDH6667284.1 secondary thiamine-phosphate synthase enzyme [Methylorubrum zatmanii]MCP1559187.1 secondary thiamine-phosphate synthase enzyme [Methylorubrum extorquens]MDF9792828.1 secondary thiamine-phosphate synthase enzyme [Methylorubrum e
MRQAGRSAGKIGPLEGFSTAEVTRQASARVTVATPGPGFTDITEAVADFVAESGIHSGLVSVFCRHTSASLTIQENADPDVRVDLMTALDGFAPRHRQYVHGMEGPDDMPAHIRTMVTDSGLTIPVRDGRLALGTWQGIYLIEHRDRAHRREIALHAVGA